jgi:hypothetical protein
MSFTGTSAITTGSSNGTYTIMYNSDSVSVGQPVFATETPAGTTAKVEFKKGEDGINVGLFFRFMKSKLSKIEKERLKKRVMNLQKVALDANDMGQIVMYEDVTKMLAVAIRESEAVVCGFDKYIDRSVITKYMEMVKDRKNVKWETMDRFPRTIPRPPKMKIKRAQERKLFDEYWILYTDYTKEVDTPKKTTKEKIREKDPIVFGAYKYAPERLYFIADWVDAYCDITMDQVVEKMKEEDKEFGLTEVPNIDKKFNDRIKEEVAERHRRLAETNRSNWQDLERAEGKAQKSRKSFWAGMFKRKAKE